MHFSICRKRSSFDWLCMPVLCPTTGFGVTTDCSKHPEKASLSVVGCSGGYGFCDLAGGLQGESIAICHCHQYIDTPTAHPLHIFFYQAQLAFHYQSFWSLSLAFSAFFLLSTVWYSVIRTKFLSYIKAGATQTEMSLLKQYAVRNVWICLNFLSVLRRFQWYGKAQ